MHAILNPKTTDVRRLAEIAAAADIRSAKTLQRGFLLFPWSEAQFREHVRRGYLLCVFTRGGTEPVGFLTGFTAREVDEVLNESPNEMLSSLLRAMRSSAAQQKDADYNIVYQLALAPEVQALGLGSKCYKLFARLVPGPLYGVVLEKPVRSVRLAFWRALGFRHVGEVTAPAPTSLATAFTKSTPDPEMTWTILRNPNVLYKSQSA